MSDMVLKINLPLEEDEFFRRECPYCFKEFKIQLSKEDLIDLEQKGIESFLTNNNNLTDEDEDMQEQFEYYCPYCGQQERETQWWTQEQLEYIGAHVENIVVELINDNLNNTFQRSLNETSGFLPVSLRGNKVPLKEPWISNETNDMKVLDLPCCNKKMKIDEKWEKDIFCFYCGFVHKQNDGSV